MYRASSKQMSYINVAMKYFTKWVEAKTIKKNDANTTAMILYKNISTRFRCPKILINVRGSPL